MRTTKDSEMMRCSVLRPEARTPRSEPLFTSEVLDLLTILSKNFEPERAKLLDARHFRQMEFNRGGFPTWEVNHPAQTESWRVAPIPEDLLCRKVEITGPVNSSKMVLNMLSENEQGALADTAMLDFEDSMKPTWENVIEGIHNVREVALGTLSYTKRDESGKAEKTYKLNPKRMAKMMVRVRGLHLEEANVQIDGKSISASLFDLALCAAHSAREQVDRKQTPKFYIPKCEHYLEARWWNRVFGAIEEFLHLPRGCMRVTLLIETLPAAFQMEEILYEIRERACGLNVGRWDKIFSDIKVLREHSALVFTDRSRINMECSWMDNYAKLLVKTCHKHGAFALGGMSAFTPGKDPETRMVQTKKIQNDKSREASIGHDGCWVSHPYFIGIAKQMFPDENQLSVSLSGFPDRPNLLPQPMPAPSMAGLRTNIRVALVYQKGWNEGLGCVAFDYLMEDLATLEISRAQVWQWIHHGVILEGGVKVTPALVTEIFEAEMRNIVSEAVRDLKPSETEISSMEKSFTVAKDQACALFLEKELRDFFNTSSK